MITVVNRHSQVQYDGHTFYVGRGTLLGNKYSHHKIDGCIKCKDRDEAVSLYREWLRGQILSNNSKVITALKKIRELSKSHKINLECSCSPRRCHADVIKEAAETWDLDATI